MANVTNTLIANITTAEDSTQNVPINRSTGNPQFDVNFGEFTTYQKLIINGANPITLPGTPVYQVYVRNLDPTNDITVQWTPQSGALVTVCTLKPGDQIILWQKNSGAGSSGITALSFSVTTAAGVLVEYFLGG